jgi:hypothetical protein
MALNTKHMIVALALGAGGLAAATGGALATSNPNDLSPANQALYTTDHMASIKKPAVLVYDFEKSGSLETGFTDTVEAEVTGVEADGGKDITFHFLNGEHHVDFRDFEDFTGNPVFMLFLERDVMEMAHLTRGHALYYRNRIRNALAGSAEMKDTSFEFGGKTVKGTEISVMPYADDPLNERYPRFAKKKYVFVLSKDVPGGFFKIDSVTPDPSGTQPLVAETLTFHDVHAPETKHAAAAKRETVADKVNK